MKEHSHIGTVGLPRDLLSRSPCIPYEPYGYVDTLMSPSATLSCLIANLDPGLVLWPQKDLSLRPSSQASPPGGFWLRSTTATRNQRTSQIVTHATLKAAALCCSRPRSLRTTQASTRLHFECQPTTAQASNATNGTDAGDGKCAMKSNIGLGFLIRPDVRISSKQGRGAEYMAQNRTNVSEKMRSSTKDPGERHLPQSDSS